MCGWTDLIISHYYYISTLILQVPLIIPVIVLIASVYLVLAPIIDNPRMEFLYAFLFTVGGLIFYFPFVHFKWRLPGIGNFKLTSLKFITEI